jgi:hypothetical protein
MKARKVSRFDEIIEEATSASVEKIYIILTVIVLAQGSALELVVQLVLELVLELALESAFESDLELALL